MDSVFVRNASEYVRNLDILPEAIRVSAQYLHLSTGAPIEECIAFVEQETAPGGQFQLKEANLKVLKKQPNGDRVRAVLPISKVISVVKHNDHVLSPNMVVYVNADKQLSITSQYIVGKRSKRKIIKKKGLLAEQAGEKLVAMACSNAEYKIKILVNSISGARLSPHNPLYLKTAHSTLTSTTRTIVSYSNACTEKLAYGSRHYWSKDVVIENILTIISNTDFMEMRKVIDYYGLVYPTTDDLIDMVNRSIKFYWANPIHLKQIRNLIDKLSPLQKAAILYTGDLYHIKKLNDNFMRGLIQEVITEPDVDYPIDTSTYLDSANGDIVALCGILCDSFMAGKSAGSVKADNPDDYFKYCNRIEHVKNILLKYKSFIKVFFLSDNVPSSIVHFPNSMRRAVAGSDTDSTMYTVQDWVSWYYGQLCFTQEANHVANFISFFNSSAVAHTLALCSKQLGVRQAGLFNLKMKNEFSFLFYFKANRAKHYVTLNTSREGNVYAVPKLDTKGVGMKDSKVPRFIINGLDNEIISIMETIRKENTFEIHPILHRVANLEHYINDSLLAGNINFLSTKNISPASAYKVPMVSNFVHYHLWENVFKEEYGAIEAPPYRAVKLSVNMSKGKDLQNWINGMPADTAERMRKWLAENNKKGFTQLLVPYSMFEYGLSKTFIDAIDRRRIIGELMGPWYIFLEMCGFYLRNKKAPQLLMDTIASVPSYGYPCVFPEVILPEEETDEDDDEEELAVLDVSDDD